MDDGCLDWADQSNESCGDTEDMDDADADEQVLLDGAIGAAVDRSSEHDLGEVVGEERDVGCFEGGLGAPEDGSLEWKRAGLPIAAGTGA